MRCYLNLQFGEENAKKYGQVMDIYEGMATFEDLKALVKKKIVRTIDKLKNTQTTIDQNFEAFDGNSMVHEMQESNIIPVWSINSIGKTEL